MQLDLTGPAGRLEAIFEAAAGRAGTFAALVCHPHPRFGGTMHNHATYRLAKAVRARGGDALRFNFRGVGRSAGRYGGGDAEALDAAAALDWLARERPGVPLLACGFSFGAWIAILAGGADPRVSGLLLAGLALRAPDLERFRESGRARDVERPLAVIQAERDQFGTPAEVEAALAGSRGPRRVVAVPGATHLLAEDLGALQREAEAAIAWLLAGGREAR
ncbi:MAG TPA: alpha/beta family hydrolase [Anaeromyxobacter sp.]|nr:alpha/beta family hydrolase [Anaeromyxobacter sp.]